MKRWICLLAIGSMIVLLAAGDGFARGGRGGGGGGGRGGGGFSGGGMSRPSPSVSRSPSMSRPSPSPSRPSGSSRPSSPSVGRPTPGAGTPGAGRPGTGAGVGAGSRPTQGQLNNFLDLPAAGAGGGAVGVGTRPAAGIGGGAAGVATRPAAGAGGAAAAFLQNTPATGAIGARPGVGAGAAARPGDLAANRAQNFQSRQPNRVENRQQLHTDRTARRDEINNQFREHAGEHHDWYGDNFWHNCDHPYFGLRPGVDWWRVASWSAITGWVGYGWSEPQYYSYGENVYYQGDQVYYGDTAATSAEQYADQAATIAQSVPENVDPNKLEWLPLGVFAMTKDGESSGAEPTLFLQLAVSKEGIISGTMQNTAANTTENIEGMVDKRTQRAAWNKIGSDSPIMETGIQNLTLDTAPALIHFADGSTQQWLLVRMDKPQGAATPAPPAAP